ncbi:MAG: hypothetical protein A2X94_12455 [Bdellovibrionales bacterium GWB1_55_8]|nr:MAG: hypothetical protein A2X94_12455 [Bdellovibrionales bacterium GWB1_55_8]
MILGHPLALLAALLSFSAQAVERGCLVAEIEDMLGGHQGHGSKVNVGPYQAAEKILFLSDSGAETDGLSLGELIADAFPSKTVVRTDLQFHESSTVGNLSTLFMDNTKPFPFKDNTFDTIVMRKGLLFFP